MLPYDGKLKHYSRELRRSPTDAERHLWKKLQMKQLNGFQFYRQKIIGDYIVDFYCPKARLVIEVDGGQHYSAEMAEADRKRDAYMSALGLMVLRFSDIDVLNNVDGVAENILANIAGLV